MGIDIVTAPLLANAAKHTRVDGEALMLGRQTLQIPENRQGRFNTTMAGLGFSQTYSDLHQNPPHFAEPFFDALGIKGIRSVDAAAYEGSDIIHDLNQPVDDSLTDRFSFIYDGGTLEHVFNAPTAMDNVHNMLKPGGIFVSATTGDGWFGHGFWQMSPEVAFSYWGTSRGYEILEVKEAPIKPRLHPIDIPDPRKTGKRAKRRTGGSSIYLWYAVRKPEKQVKFTTPQQSDYQTIWDNDDQDS